MDLSCWGERNHQLKIWRENLLSKKSLGVMHTVCHGGRESVCLHCLMSSSEEEGGGHDFFNSSFPFLALNVIVGSS